MQILLVDSFNFTFFINFSFNIERCNILNGNTKDKLLKNGFSSS